MLCWLPQSEGNGDRGDSRGWVQENVKIPRFFVIFHHSYTASFAVARVTRHVEKGSAPFVNLLQIFFVFLVCAVMNSAGQV
jgi:hypothetical protein